MVKRVGNFGFVDDGAGGVYSFTMGSKWTPSTFMIRGGSVTRYGSQYMSVNGVNIIPFGSDNDLPGRVCRLLEKFYAGEGIMGKKIGLQWGEGPRLYRDAVGQNNTFYRSWCVDEEIMNELKRIDFMTQMERCLTDLVHLEGFWVKFRRNRGWYINKGKFYSVEHIPAEKVRFVWNGEGKTPTHAMVADFPDVSPENCRVYPIMDPREPLRHSECVAYYNLYSFTHEHYSVPRYVGAFEWIDLAGSIPELLANFNTNASAISKHIESPQSYWDAREEEIKEYCLKAKIPYNKQMLEDFKNEAMEKFASALSGKENVGKFIHTQHFWSPEANAFEGWKVTPIDNKIKEYIDSQMSIAKKSEAAATSGFGLDPSLSNLILDSKLGSGSEKLYALKVYNATETALPDMVLCKPFQQFIDANFPGTDVRIGLYRTVVEAEKNINPEDRVKANV